MAKIFINLMDSCSICENIPRQKHYSHYTLVPKEVLLLEPQKEEDEQVCPIIRTCPKCSNYYWYEHSQEYEDTSCYYDINIQRLFTVELLLKLKDIELQKFQENLTAQLSFYQEQLQNPVLYLKQDACYALLVYYLYHQDYKAICQLLQHEDEQIVVVILEYFVKNNLTTLPLEQVELLKLFEVSLDKKTCFYHATALVVSYAVLLEKKAVVLPLLNSLIEEIREGAWLGFFAAIPLIKQGFTTYKSNILEIFQDETFSIRYACSNFLVHLTKMESPEFDAPSFILEQLKTKNLKACINTSDLFNAYTQTSKNYDWAILTTCSLLDNKELISFALGLLDVFAVRHLDKMHLALPYFEPILKEGTYFDLNKLLYFIHKIQVTAKINIESILPAMVHLIHFEKNKYRVIVSHILRDALYKGANLTFAEEDLLLGSTSNFDYNDQYITEILTNIYLRNNNHEKLNALFLNSNHKVRYSTLQYLNDTKLKGTLSIDGFIEAIVANLKYEQTDIRTLAEKIINYFKTRSLEDKILINKLL